jgi:hypothetical protein
MMLSLVLLGAVFQITFVGGGSVGATVGPQLQPPTSTSSAKDKCTVTGIVTSMQTGEPLKKATLHLTMRNTSRNLNAAFEQTGYSGTSGPDGSFKFEAVEPGEYALSGERTGYITTQYGSKNGMTGGSMLSLTPGQQLTGVKIQLVAQATITGRVLDEDGDPVGGMQVIAYGRMWMQGAKPRYFPMGQVTTDDTGSYRLANLRPGKYYVSTQSQRNQMMGVHEKPAEPGKPDIRPVTTFYPSSLDLTGASAVELKAGQEMPGIEIRIRAVQTFHVRGKVAGDIGGGENDNRRVMLVINPVGEAGGILSFFNGMTMVSKDHTFDMSGVTPGSYVITNANSGGKNDSIRQVVEVGSGDVEGIMLTPQPTFAIHGSVELQGTLAGSAKDKALEGIVVMLAPDDMTTMMMHSAQATTKTDGSFTMENVVPSKFRVRVMNEPEGAYVKSVRFGSQEALGKTLDLTQAGGGDIHVTLRAAAAEVSGTVMAKNEDAASGNSSAMAPASGVSVLLIPEDLTRDGGSVHTSGTNLNGAFTEKGLAPGTYYAVAFETDEYRNFDDPVILKQLVAKGVKVEVKENDKRQVQVTLLPAQELRAALTAAGTEN